MFPIYLPDSSYSDGYWNQCFELCEKKDINYNKESIENVLINSNFTCGFFINRAKLYKIL